MSKLSKFFYRVLKEEEWIIFKKIKEFRGNELDHKSGFIHLSTSKQLKETINLYFKKEKKIVVIKLKLTNKKLLKWEISRGDKLFPHFYGTLNFNDVEKVQIVKNSNAL